MVALARVVGGGGTEVLSSWLRLEQMLLAQMRVGGERRVKEVQRTDVDKSLGSFWGWKGGILRYPGHVPFKMPIRYPSIKMARTQEIYKVGIEEGDGQKNPCTVRGH